MNVIQPHLRHYFLNTAMNTPSLDNKNNIGGCHG